MAQKTDFAEEGHPSQAEMATVWLLLAVASLAVWLLPIALR
jgi:hypothetical protein